MSGRYVSRDLDPVSGRGKVRSCGRDLAGLAPKALAELSTVRRRLGWGRSRAVESTSE